MSTIPILCAGTQVIIPHDHSQALVRILTFKRLEILHGFWSNRSLQAAVHAQNNHVFRDLEGQRYPANDEGRIPIVRELHGFGAKNC